MASTDRRWRCRGLFAVLACLPPARAPTQVPSSAATVIVGLEDRTRVVRYDAGARRSVQLYESERYVDDVTVSPDGRYVAFRERVASSAGAKDRLVVLLPTGQSVRTMDHRGVTRYTWCCGTGRVAFIGGEEGEGGIGFRPHGLFLLDVVVGTQQQITGLELPYQVTWAAFDSSLYVKSVGQIGGRRQPVVHRYHVPTGTLSPTGRRGVFFSPDGAYYLDKSEEGPDWHLYRAGDDLEVTARLSVPPATLRFPPVGWAAGAPHMLVFVEREGPAGGPDSVPRRRVMPPRPRPAPGARHVYPDRWNLAVDAATGQVISRFQGDVGAGWRTNAPAIAVERRGGVDLVLMRGP